MDENEIERKRGFNEIRDLFGNGSEQERPIGKGARNRKTGMPIIGDATIGTPGNKGRMIKKKKIEWDGIGEGTKGDGKGTAGVKTKVGNVTI
jgi:hypothetical protein